MWDSDYSFRAGYIPAGKFAPVKENRTASAVRFLLYFDHWCPQLEQTHITSLEPRQPATRPAPPARSPPRTAPPRLKPFLTNWMLVPPHLGQRRRAASVFSTMSGSKSRFCFADGSIAALSGSFGVMLPALLAIFVPGCRPGGVQVVPVVVSGCRCRPFPPDFAGNTPAAGGLSFTYCSNM